MEVALNSTANLKQSVENNSKEKSKFCDSVKMKISPAVLLLASKAASETVVINRTKKLEVEESVDGSRSGML